LENYLELGSWDPSIQWMQEDVGWFHPSIIQDGSSPEASFPLDHPTTEASMGIPDLWPLPDILLW
jgi:hypothetical protein